MCTASGQWFPYQSNQRPATERQRRYADILGLTLPISCSVAEASAALSTYFETNPTPGQLKLAAKYGMSFPPGMGSQAASLTLIQAEKDFLDANPKIALRRQRAAEKREAKQKADRECWERDHAQEIEVASDWHRMADEDIYLAVAYKRGREVKSAVVRVIGPAIISKGRVDVDFIMQSVRYDRVCQGRFLVDGRVFSVRLNKIVWFEELGKLEIDDAIGYEVGLEAAQAAAESYSEL